ncbi:MAG: hypothetical protein JST43_07920 [Bacteroidetes bacterium]|nr:hypothetical protein [Bacteroidota bacterium]MBS1539172.1 hypothetical protein [Bacteroidota bacterium]
MKAAAQVISFVFHPLLIATYLVLTLGLIFPAMLMIRPEHLVLVTVFVFGFTFVMPLLNLWLFKIWGTIRSFQLPTQKERILPFVFICGIYTMVSLLFYYRLPFHSHLNKVMIIITLLVITATALNFFIKVSVHSLAMGGWIGILLPLIQFSPDLLIPTAGVIVLTGVVASSRLALQAHTLREISMGLVAGLLTSYGGMVLLF